MSSNESLMMVIMNSLGLNSPENRTIRTSISLQHNLNVEQGIDRLQKTTIANTPTPHLES
jgi:hypothetical protein